MAQLLDHDPVVSVMLTSLHPFTKHKEVLQLTVDRRNDRQSKLNGDA